MKTENIFQKTLSPGISKCSSILFRWILGIVFLTGLNSLAAQDAYRYYRFTPTDLRNFFGANSVQLAEIEFQVAGVTVEAVAAENPGGENPGSETPPMAIDGSLNTKWLDFLKGPLIVDLGSSLRLEQYRWATANDAVDRDPTRWTLEGSNNKTNWTLIDDRSAEDFPTPLERFTFTEWLVPSLLPELGSIELFTVTANGITSDSGIYIAEPGEVVVRWSVDGATGVTLSAGNFGILPPLGERNLLVNEDLLLTLTALSDGGEESRSIQILVNPEFEEIRINEILAGATSSEAAIKDPKGEAADWIEIYNPNPYIISLEGYGLANTTDPQPIWYFPSGSTLEAGAYGVIFASGETVDAGTGPWSADFQLALEGEPLALVLPDGSRINPFGIGYPEQFENISYGITTAGVWDYYTEPTPGRANDTSIGLPLLQAPVFTQEAPLFSGTLSVVLTTDVEGADIRYTLNGSEPTQNSTLYTGAIQINQTTQIRARLTTAGKAPGPIVSKTFTQISSDLSEFTSNLPIILLDNYGTGGVTTGSILNEMNFVLIEPDAVSAQTDLSLLPSVSHRGGFKRRGSSTINDPKGNYRIEFWDEEDRDTDVELLGLSNHADWVLFAPYRFDRSLIRIPFIHRLSNNIGLYAPKSRMVEVFLNQDDRTMERSDYVGVYVLQEQISRDNNRVDIARLDASDFEEPGISGGYILSIDRPDGGTEPFRTTRGTPTLPLQGSPRPWFNHIYPKEDDLLPEQVNYIKGFLDQMENALYGQNFTDPVDGYRQYLDVRSFVDYHILNVLAKDPDALRLSTYMNKDRSGPLKMGPIWDYDRTMGNDSDGRSANPEGWDPAPENAGFFIYDWWGRLFEDPDFWQDWIDRWQFLRETEMSDEKISLLVQFLADQVAPVQGRNFDRWPEVSPNGGQFSSLPGWEGEVEHLENWLTLRSRWIDSQFPSKPAFNIEPGRVESGTELSLSSLNGEVYYTLDGTDPRLSGGAVSPGAILFSSGLSEVEWVGSNHSVSYRVPTAEDIDSVDSWFNRDFDDAGFTAGSNGVGYDDATTYEPLIKSDVNAEMNDINTSIWIRIPFEVASLGQLQALQLQMRYDDGFIAYLNGNPIAQANSPGFFPTTIDVGATGSHSDTQAVDFATFSIPLDDLNVSAGSNLLAIHGLNNGISSSDFLIEARLVALVAQSTNAIIAEDTTRISARAFDGTHWSSLQHGTFFTTAEADVTRLLISEIHYRPSPASLEDEARGFSQRKDFEFLELYNPTDAWMDLSGVKVVGGITFDFNSPQASVRELSPGGRLVLVNSTTAFEWRHAERLIEIVVGGEYDGSLSDEGEAISLQIADVPPFYTVNYGVSAPWPVAPEDAGFSLVYRFPDNLPLPDPSASVNWALDPNPMGSPGSVNELGVRFEGDPFADTNGDGLPDFLNYAFGYPEETEDVADYLKIAWINQSSDGTPLANPYVEVQIRERDGAVDALIEVETSDDLMTWETITVAWELVSTEDIGFGLSSKTYQLKTSELESFQNGKFVRVRALQVAP